MQFENKLQARLFVRRFRYTAVVVWLILGVVAAIFVQNAYADAPPGSDPTNAPGWPTLAPAGLYTANSCTRSTCPDVIWFSGNDAIGSTFSNSTCVSLGTETDYVALDANLGNYLQFGPAGHGVGSVTYCYYSGTWNVQVTSLVGLHRGSVSGQIGTNIEIRTINGYNSVGAPGYTPSTAAPNDVLVSANYTYGPTATLEKTTAGSVKAGVPFTMRVSYASFASSPRWLYFYPSGRQSGNCGSSTPNGPCPTNRVEVSADTALPYGNGSGSTTFNYTYPFGWPSGYSGAVLISSDCGEFGLNTSYNSCEVARGSLSIFPTGSISKDDVYPSILNFPPTGRARLVGEPQPYNWDINPALCTGSTIASKTLYRGYPGQGGASDPGEQLSSNSGTGALNFPYTSQDSGNPKPYIQFYCSNGNSNILYYKNTLYASKATPLTIDSTSTLQYWVGTWENGGNSTDWNGTGSGAQFFTDKKQYLRQEAVRMLFTYNVQFTVGAVTLYPDPDQLPSLSFEMTGALLIPGRPHNYSFIYEDQGFYYPKFRVKSVSYNPSDPSTYRDVWLGGNEVRDQGTFVTVTSGIFGSLQFVPGVRNESGDLIGAFGLPASALMINFPPTDNIFLQFIEDAVNHVISALWYIVSFAFSVLEAAPPFQLMHNVFLPTPGVHYLPQKIFGDRYPLPPGMAGQPFTVTYADPVTTAPIQVLFKTMITVCILMGLLHEIFPESNN